MSGVDARPLARRQKEEAGLGEVDLGLGDAAREGSPTAV